MQPTLLPDGRKLHHYADGSMFTSIHLGCGVLVICVDAHIMFDEMADDALREAAAVYEAEGRIVCMIDGRRSSGVSTRAREQGGAWFRARMPSGHVHLLQNSRLLVMAVSLTNLMLRKQVSIVHTNIEDWERVITREVGGFDRRLLDLPNRRLSLIA